MVNRLPQPHDLLWGFSREHLAADAPPWCFENLRDDLPVVVRRALARDGLVAVGLRGQQRVERHAAWLPLAAVTRCICPEQLIEPSLIPLSDLPVWQALRRVRPFLQGTGLTWGVTGSAGFQLASGQPVVHAGSDLDLLLRTTRPLSRVAAQRLLDDLSCLPCRVDVQLQTPHGGVALAEWARAATRVLVKTPGEPLLLDDPWKEHVA